MDEDSGNFSTADDQNDQKNSENHQKDERIVEIESVNEDNGEEDIIDFTISADSVGNKGEEVGSVVEEEGDPRTNITKGYLESPGIIEEGKFNTHKELVVPGAAEGKIALFSSFFAATLQVENQLPLLVEIGDIFNEYIFITCIHHAETSDLKLVFIKTSWLAKCPPVSDGIEVMKTCDGNNIFIEYMLL